MKIIKTGEWDGQPITRDETSFDRMERVLDEKLNLLDIDLSPSDEAFRYDSTLPEGVKDNQSY